MTPLTLLSILLISTFFFTLYHFLLSLLSNPKSPSPPPLIKSHPIIGNFLPYYANRGRLLHWYTSLLSSSQTLTLTLTRLGARRTVITADPANVEHILKTNFPNYPKGPAFADILSDLLGQGIFASDGPRWFHQRKLASHHFSARKLRSLVFSSVQCGTRRHLFSSLLTAAETGSHLDLQELLKQLTFDVICMITLGVDSADVAQLGPAFELAAAVSARRGTAPVFAVWKAKRALNIGSERLLRSAIRSIHTSITDIINRRRKEIEQEDSKRDDVLSELIGGGHSDDVILDMVVSFVMAGRDTTSAALTWFFWLVSRHPEIEAEILKEIREKKQQHYYDDYNGLKKMKLLEASLLETMRLYPPVVWDSKYAENDDVLPDGTRVTRGDRVTYFPYGMGRMERIWGKDWGEFRPGRWTEAGEVKKSVYEYPVFQAGPRVCLGKEMAFVQMKYVAAAVLGRFELRRKEGKEEGGPPDVVPLMTAHMAGGLNVVVRERGRV